MDQERGGRRQGVERSVGGKLLRRDHVQGEASDEPVEEEAREGLKAECVPGMERQHRSEIIQREESAGGQRQGGRNGC